MLLFFGKFILFYLFGTIAFALFKVMYYSISKKLITKTADGTKLNWALNVFVKNGKKLDSNDYFVMGVFAGFCTIYL
ncbi:hypothetical protein VJC19_07630 [Bacillus paralicheniformis]|uniref:Uncharacterized protein n=3 Tax=Bacillus TaxID=1386 RepID=A0A7Z0WUY0_9BACI|nr:MULTISPECIES: hypothetical protein [Bacillus]ETB69276.1 hypothetical protein A943_21280 [Bacillus sp. CPSM8]NVB35777.1 hypothetical protein [Bacillus licheniformis]AJO18267.1 hypothetical protein SC10_B2orf03032 [Bacillus paralicheniformis]EWH20023.1 hypothetical protein M769_0123405 [Bacillus haynesii]MDR9799571.1 hypothetical protein [Bacillus paralicheniformis]